MALFALFKVRHANSPVYLLDMDYLIWVNDITLPPKKTFAAFSSSQNFKLLIDLNNFLIFMDVHRNCNIIFQPKKRT